MPRYKLRVNGRIQSVDAPEDMPVLWVLRDLLQLTGTKFGCGIAQCRACTVHLDGEPTVSCLLPVSSVGEKEITTIEGIGSGGLHPVQKAWVDEQVPQCGFCQPGQIMSAVALLRKVPRPSDQEIETTMSPHICRCGTYNRIRKAIHRAAGSGDAR